MSPFFQYALLFLFISCASQSVKNDLQCPVCGMHFNSTAKTSFQAHEGEGKKQVCSFSCASRLKKRFHSKLQAKDYSSGEWIEAESAYYLIRSRNLLKELDFDMPPSVVAFGSEREAYKKLKELGDGKIVGGFGALEKTYE